MVKWFKSIAIVVFVLFGLSEASAASSALREKETVSHKALQITGKASNWTRARVYNPKTDLLFSEKQYTKLPVGAIVEFDDELTIARPVEVREQTIASVCRGFAINASNCARRLAFRNGISEVARDAEITRTLWVPKEWQVSTPPAQATHETPSAPMQSSGFAFRFLAWLGQYWQLALLRATFASLIFFTRHRWAWRIKRKLRNGRPRVFAHGIEHDSLTDVQAHHRPPPTAETPPETEHRPTRTPLTEG